MASKRTALVLGASGMIGRRLVQALLAEPAYSAVRVLVRHPLTIQHPRLIQEVVDFEALPEGDTAFACDVLFITFGTTMARAGSKEAFRRIDYEIPLETARRARQAGAESLVLVSAVGADPGSLFFYSRVKGLLERHLRDLAFTRLLIFRPSILLGDRQESRPGEKVAMLIATALRKISPGVLGKWSGMPASMLASAMVRASLQPEAGTFIFHYPETEALASSNILHHE